jgi:RNA polymerase sigma-70 factor (ECF subfamily)
MSHLEELLQRLRAGDEAAAAEFFRTYEPHVRRVVRARMRIDRLRRVSDSSDLCQAVLASFLIRAAVGRYEIAGSGALKALLARVASNKVAELARRPEFQRSVYPIAGPDEEGVDPVAREAGPASQIAFNELFQRASELLTASERRIAELRQLGRGWTEIGAELGETADAVRKRLDRALKRIVQELGLPELSDE